MTNLPRLVKSTSVGPLSDSERTEGFHQIVNMWLIPRSGRQTIQSTKANFESRRLLLKTPRRNKAQPGIRARFQRNERRWRCRTLRCVALEGCRSARLRRKKWQLHLDQRIIVIMKKTTFWSIRISKKTYSKMETILQKQVGINAERYSLRWPLTPSPVKTTDCPNQTSCLGTISRSRSTSLKHKSISRYTQKS